MGQCGGAAGGISLLPAGSLANMLCYLNPHPRLHQHSSKRPARKTKTHQHAGGALQVDHPVGGRSCGHAALRGNRGLAVAADGQRGNRSTLRGALPCGLLVRHVTAKVGGGVGGVAGQLHRGALLGHKVLLHAGVECLQIQGRHAVGPRLVVQVGGRGIDSGSAAVALRRAAAQRGGDLVLQPALAVQQAVAGRRAEPAAQQLVAWLHARLKWRGKSGGRHPAGWQRARQLVALQGQLTQLREAARPRGRQRARQPVVVQQETLQAVSGSSRGVKRRGHASWAHI